MFAGKAERFARPQAIDDREAFVHQFRARLQVYRLADFRESSIIWSSTQACGENQAAIRKMIERSSLPRKLPRTPARYCSDEGTHADALRLCSDRGKHHPGVEQRHGFAGETLNRNTIGHEYTIPTRGLRGLGHLALHARFPTWNNNSVSHAAYFTLRSSVISWIGTNAPRYRGG